MGGMLDHVVGETGEMDKGGRLQSAGHNQMSLLARKKECRGRIKRLFNGKCLKR